MRPGSLEDDSQERILPIMKALAAHAALFGLLFVRSIGLGPHVQSTLSHPPSAKELAELWVEPYDLVSRDLVSGPWGPSRARTQSGSDL